MLIKAAVRNRRFAHDVVVSTNDAARSLSIPPKDAGRGSSVNGGELFLLALATCYCNDVYREAAKRGLTIEAVEVTAEADFVAEGRPAENLRYRVRIVASAGERELRDLARHADEVAEIQRTVRQGAAVTLESVEIESVGAGPRP